MTFVEDVTLQIRKQVSTFKGACGTEQDSQRLATLGLQNLCLGGDSEGRRGSQVAGLNAVIKVLLGSLFNFSYIVGTIEDWKFLDYFCGVHLVIYIFFAPTLKDMVLNYPPGAQSIIQTLLNRRDQPVKQRKKMSPIHHGDTAEGQEVKV